LGSEESKVTGSGLLKHATGEEKLNVLLNFAFGGLNMKKF
jgi:hypothetical protein